MEIHLVESELFHADRGTEGRTDRHDEANSRFFYNFANAPKKANCRWLQSKCHWKLRL